jgi:hypothetical protein
MTNHNLKIIFKDGRAFFAPDRPLDLNALGLLEIYSKFKEPAYWNVRIGNFLKAEKRVYCEVISYHKGETEFESEQLRSSKALGEIEKVSFSNIDTAGLLTTLGGRSKGIRSNYNEFETSSNHPVSDDVEAKRRNFIIREKFNVPLKKVKFGLGCVIIDKRFKEYTRPIEVRIINIEIREEFDAVKNYFANVLNTKKIEVSVVVEVEDDEVVSIEASSPEIARINKELIDNVKFEFVRTTKKKIKIEVDKTIFTMEEYFDAFADDGFKSNTFYKDEKELFEDILTISNSKHYNHLRFLSSIHAHEIMRLRFVNKPFSFIFLVKGERNYHVIWETLDTEEATYIWHLPKDIPMLKLTLKKIEDIINTIKVEGKTAYTSSTDDAFRRIYHDYSIITDGFMKWKGELENYLT